MIGDLQRTGGNDPRQTRYRPAASACTADCHAPPGVFPWAWTTFPHLFAAVQTHCYPGKYTLRLVRRSPLESEWGQQPLKAALAGLLVFLTPYRRSLSQIARTAESTTAGMKSQRARALKTAHFNQNPENAQDGSLKCPLTRRFVPNDRAETSSNRPL